MYATALALLQTLLKNRSFWLEGLPGSASIDLFTVHTTAVQHDRRETREFDGQKVSFRDIIGDQIRQVEAQMGPLGKHFARERFPYCVTSHLAISFLFARISGKPTLACIKNF